MPFHVPPVNDEVSSIRAFLAQQQDAFRVVAHGLTDAEAGKARSASTLTVGGLIKHVTQVQEHWLRTALAAPQRDDRKVDPESHHHGFQFDGDLAAQLAAFDEVSARVLDAVDSLDLSTPVPVPEAPWFPKDVTWSVRWVWMHLIEELARHAGHADIVRESLDGAQMFSLGLARDGLGDLPFLKSWRREPLRFSRGVSTVRLHADDLTKATEWYSELLGAEPYFVQPEYVEWRVGPNRHELGILDRKYADDHDGLGSVVYWDVEDLESTIADLLERGGSEHEAIRAGEAYR
ncbi:MAG: DUF664 domain-containing protein, partial [Nocardiaceae bacterium]|nr:DUF664 domain-containing protein [Nocardiaceae bacterium]